MADARNMTDRELLLAVHTAVQDIRHDVYGNGQPGLLKDVEALKERTGPSRTQVLSLNAAFTAALVALAEFMRTRLTP